MDGLKDYHTKQSKLEKDKYHMITYVEHKIKYKSTIHKQKQAYRCREQICGWQGEEEVGREGIEVWD